MKKTILILTTIILASCSTPRECYGQNLNIYTVPPTASTQEKVDDINYRINNYLLQNKKGQKNMQEGFLYTVSGSLVSIMILASEGGEMSFPVLISGGAAGFGVFKSIKGYIQTNNALKRLDPNWYAKQVRKNNRKLVRKLKRRK